MSLDVYLEGEEREENCRCVECWNEHSRKFREQFYHNNITHNLHKMADAAGIYQYLWRPDELGITQAQELIEPLEKGLALLHAEPERFKVYDAPNGWGRYENLVAFVHNYLAACREHPDARVSVSR